MADQWYYTRQGQQSGPVTSAQLRQLAACGQLQPRDLVWRPGMKEWIAAEQIGGLFSTASPVKTPEPPPILQRPPTLQAPPIVQAPAQASPAIATSLSKAAPAADRAAMPSRSHSHRALYIAVRIGLLLFVSGLGVVVLNRPSSNHAKDTAISTRPTMPTPNDALGRVGELRTRSDGLTDSLRRIDQTIAGDVARNIAQRKTENKRNEQRYKEVMVRAAEEQATIERDRKAKAKAEADKVVRYANIPPTEEEIQASIDELDECKIGWLLKKACGLYAAPSSFELTAHDAKVKKLADYRWEITGDFRVLPDFDERHSHVTAETKAQYYHAITHTKWRIHLRRDTVNLTTLFVEGRYNSDKQLTENEGVQLLVGSQARQDDHERTLPLQGTPLTATKGSPATAALHQAEPFRDYLRIIDRIAFSPTGDHLLVIPENDDKGSLWSVASWERKEPGSADCRYFSLPAAFSPDDKYLACRDGELIRIWDITKSPASLLNTLPGYRAEDDPCWDGVEWANDGTLITRSPEGGFQFFGEDATEGAVLVGAVGCGKYGFFDMQSKDRLSLNSLKPGILQLRDIIVSPTGKAFGAINGDKDNLGVFVWAIPSGKSAGFLKFDLPGQVGSWECLVASISRGGNILATSLHYSGTVMPPMPKTWIVSLWRSGSKPKRLDLQGKDTISATDGSLVDFRFRDFSPDGKLATTSGTFVLQTADETKVKRVVTVWDTESGRKLFQFDNACIKEVFFTKDGQTLVAGGADRRPLSNFPIEDFDARKTQTVDFWDVKTGERRFQVKDAGITGLALSPDGSVLVTAYATTAQVVGVPGGEPGDIGVIRDFAGERAVPLRVWHVK